MAERLSEGDLSPLDQIRQTESEITRKVAAARQAAEKILDQARQQAEIVKRNASEAGRLEGQRHYQTVLDRAEEEAHTLVSEAGFQAESLRRRGQQRMKTGVGYAVSVILGLAEEADP
jgi:vacuolar-type H+-ATPase subunit H